MESHSEDEFRRVPVHSLLDRSPAVRNCRESIQPCTQGASRRVEIELISCPSADGTGNQHAKRIEPAEKDQDDCACVHNLPFDSGGNETSQVWKNAPKNVHSRARMSRTARSKPTSAARAMML